MKVSASIPAAALRQTCPFPAACRASTASCLSFRLSPCLSVRIFLRTGQHLVCLFVYLLVFQSVYSSEQTDVLLYSQVGIKGEFLAHVSYVALYLLLFLPDVISCHWSRACCRTAQSAQDSHGGCLACPVGAEEAEYLPSADIETDVVHSREVSEFLREVSDFNDIQFRIHFLDSCMKQSSIPGAMSFAVQSGNPIPAASASIVSRLVLPGL